MDIKRIGDVVLSRVVESEEPLLKPAELFPDWQDTVIDENRDWLIPRFYDPRSGLLAITIQSFLLKTRHHTILVDACAGNHKDRARPFFDQREWPWLDALAATGTGPADIDFVLCTHLHVDHVGWNTQLSDGRWVPTFPNAKYLFSRLDWAFWKRESERDELARTGDYIVDSVLPIFAAGQAVLVDGEYEVEDGIRLEPTPGHSPGHVVVHIRSGGREAVLSGDVMHHPLQCRYPDWSTNFCADQIQSRATRRQFLDTYCETDVLIVPSHFPTPTAGFIETDKNAFRFRFDGEQE